jgi:putative endonuclease
MAEHNITGNYGEELAKEYLIKQGYKIIELNWRIRHLEIDIIAKHKNTIVFVEVKTRTNEYWGNPSDAITKSKQRYLVNAAHEYLTIKEIDDEARFDVIAIITENNNISIEHFENAFYPEL